MPPLAGNRVGAANDLSVHHDAPANPGAQDHAEDHCRPLARAVHRFGKREAIGVVLQPDRPAERGFQVAAQRLADEPGRVGVLDQAGGLRFRSGDSDPDGALPGVAHKRPNRSDGGRVIAARGGNALTKHFAPVAVERYRLDLRAAEIDADSAVHRRTTWNFARIGPRRLLGLSGTARYGLRRGVESARWSTSFTSAPRRPRRTLRRSISIA